MRGAPTSSSRRSRDTMAWPASPFASGLVCCIQSKVSSGATHRNAILTSAKPPVQPSRDTSGDTSGFLADRDTLSCGRGKNLSQTICFTYCWLTDSVFLLSFLIVTLASAHAVLISGGVCSVIGPMPELGLRDRKGRTCH